MQFAEALRSRFRPEWKTRPDLTGLDTMLETALSFAQAPKLKKAALEKPGTLSARGVAEALRLGLGKLVVPELRRIRRIVGERREAMKVERAVLARPKIDSTDVAGAMLHQEMRSYLRALDMGQRLQALSANSESAMLVAAFRRAARAAAGPTAARCPRTCRVSTARFAYAALEAPAALSGLTAETREHVVEAYLQANHGPALKALDDREEALAVVGAATEMVIAEIRSSVGIEPQAFISWFATANGAG